MKPSEPDQPSIALYISTDASGRKTLHIAGEVDLSTCSSFRSGLASCMVEQDSQLTIDLTHVDFMDSSGLHALMEATREIMKNGGSVSLRNPCHTVHRLLEISGLLGYFSLTD
jgi:anti-anti-sigma factor